jgi:hypothetical protein
MDYYCLNFREARDMDPVTRNVVVAWVQRNRTVFPVAPKSFDEKVLAFVDALLARIDALTAQRMEVNAPRYLQEYNNLTAQRDKALALHKPDAKNLCDECFQDWPCDTARALRAL